MVLSGTIFTMGGDFGDPLFPGAPNAAYTAQGEIVARGVIPSPGTSALVLAGTALLSTRRRR